MAAKVFISYRRDDAKWQAREIYNKLTQVLPRDHVFMDIDSIPPGADFVDVLEGWVDQCDILLALIGPSWIDITDPKTARRRLENPNDFVRIEIRKGLARGIPVVPILLDGASIPDDEKLPEDLKRLLRRNAEFVEHRTVDTDVERLIRKLGIAQGVPSANRPSGAPQQKPIATYDRVNREGCIKINAKIVHGAPEGWFKPGAGNTEWFKDHDHGPELVVVPAGSFMMGSPTTEPERESWKKGTESLLHKVTIGEPFAVGRQAVTRGQFAAFVNNSGHKSEGGAAIWKGSKWEYDPQASWRNPRFAQDDSHPVVCVNWNDARAYVAWLADKSGKTYRLLTEAKREYVARAGTPTPFWWGSSITSAQANFNGSYVYAGGGSKGEFRKATVSAGSFTANPWGLYNVHGNVWEWCEDIWHDSYAGAPNDGSAWTDGGDQSRRVVRGGAWNYAPRLLRSANRNGFSYGDRDNLLGFRVARTLTP
jgi:formylglycine-generating enzyme required for sulfatase activity